MPTVMGPISKQTWGRIWARAFRDSGFRGQLEQSPQKAAVSFFGLPTGTSVDPLYHVEGVKAHHCIKEVYEALEHLRDDRNPVKSAKVQQLADNAPGAATDADLQPIINSLHGNEWVLMKKDLNNPGQILWIHRDQHLLGATPPAAGKALTQLEWARVYAEGVLDEPVFQPLLKSDPAKAIVDMANRHSNFVLHNAGTPILTLRSSAQLFTSIQTNGTIPNTDPVKTSQTDLEAVLQRLELGIDDEYEVCLNVCLSC